MSAALVGIVIVTHGPSGRGLASAVTRLLGPGQAASIAALDVSPTEDRAKLLERIQVCVQATDQGAGVIVCCDLHGATPANCAVEAMKGRKGVVICGVNLPMVVKLATSERAGGNVDELAQAAIDTAVRSIRLERGAEGA